MTNQRVWIKESAPKRESVDVRIKNPSPAGRISTVSTILKLQRICGNQVTTALHTSGGIKPHLPSHISAARGWKSRRAVTRPGAFRIQLEQLPPPTVQAVYAQALSQLQGRQGADPTIHGYLQAAGWNTQQQILQVVGGQRTVTFHLSVAQGSLPPDTSARFIPGQTNYTQGPASPSYQMRIDVDVNPSSPTAVSDLARDLYHEGVHMLIFIDGHLPSPRSSHGTGFQDYLAYARGRSNYQSISRSLASYMQAYIPPASQPSLSRLQSTAPSLVEIVVEEKYVYDQERRVPGLAQPRSNYWIASRTLFSRLAQLGVQHNVGDQDFLDAVRAMVEVLDAIDARPAPGQQPQPGSQPPAPTP